MSRSGSTTRTGALIGRARTPSPAGQHQTPSRDLLRPRLSLPLSVSAGPHTPAQALICPNPVTDGQQAVVYGQNFCGASGCSDVTVSVDGRIVATGVKVKSDGSFAASFAVTQLFGQHTVLASQTDAGGSTISASGGFRVAAGDVSSPTPQPTHTPPSPPPHSPPASGGASPTPSRTTTAPHAPPR